ncbi:MAG TPA: TonB-dependent receptor [Kofleriaceae bacterium]|nr:TonB-dependent receptor [Kofleriaceae bacterium]
MRRLAAIAAICWSAQAYADDAQVTGIVEDALLHPLEGATVVIHDPSGNTVAKETTGKDGKFTFSGVPLGDFTVEATSPGLVGDHQHVQLTAGSSANVELVLVNSEEVITVHEDWSVPPPPPATGSVASVNRQQLAEQPGGEDRPVTDVVATQPGVVADALGNIYARGNHGSIQYQIDGVPVPDSVGSLFAASIPTRLVQSLDMYTGGMPAEYGDRLSAVVNLQTRAAGDHPEGTMQVRYGSFQTIEPGVTYSTKLADNWGMFAGGSFLYSQRALDPPSIDPILHDTGASGRVFARIDWKQCECNRYELFVTYAHNKFQIPIDPSSVPFDPNNPRPPDRFGNDAPAYVPRDTDATETEDELFSALSFVHTMDHGALQLAPYYKLSRVALFSDPRHALGPLSDPDATASDVTRLQHHAGAVASLTYKTGSHALKTGAQADFVHGTADFTAYTRAMGGGIGDATGGHDTTDALTTGAYAQDHVVLGDLSVDAGVRVDELHVMLEGGKTDDSVGVSPRLGASYAVTKDTIGHAFAGVLWQPPSPLDAASAARALGVIDPNMPVAYDLKPETDAYAELGVTSRLISELRGGLTAWGRYAWNQLDDTAIGSTSLLSNYNFRRGRAAGLEGSLDVRIGPWMSAFGNVSYGFAQGEGISSAKYLFTAEELASNGWQTLDHAQTLTANAGATIRDGRYSITGLAQYGSGLRTGPANDQHVPGHVRVDLAQAYTFVSGGYPFKVGIDIINLFDAHYAYRIANGFVGSSYAAPRSVFVTLSLPLAPEPHHAGEK